MRYLSINSNDSLLPVDIQGAGPALPKFKCGVRHTQGTVVSQNLMKLLYSENSKETTPQNINSYLISQQKNLLLSQISDSAEWHTINYKILNSNINKVLLESIKELEKLHRNFIYCNR
uniref:Uncharacterized protein n=1 Tax=Porodaedalea pini TaxID=108901 RepID=A0A5B9R911_9AGAM|nr:hypothetical protein PPIT_000067 [Porodaedalea pini]QEG56948.1 hypothetical protein PPIT_000067 [Porodaedalea pini]